MGVDEFLNGPEDDEGSLVDGLNVDGSEDDEGPFVEGLNVDGSEDDEGPFVEGLNVGGSEDDEGLLEEGLNVDGPDVTEGVNVDVVENVGGAVCPWQLPLLIETSSIAKSPLSEDPAIPSNVT